MRAIGRVWWAGVLLVEVGACGPRVSVGDLGAGSAAGAGGSGQGDDSGMSMPAGGTKVTGGGAPNPGGGTKAVAGGGRVDDSGGAAAEAMGGAGELTAAGGSSAGGAAASCDAWGPFLPPVVANCPSTPPTDDHGPCDVAENAICVWQSLPDQGNTQPGYEAAGCYATPTGTHWYGAGQGVAEPFGKLPELCPLQQPEPDSSCGGHADQRCFYPTQFCSCAPAPGSNWACEANPKPAGLPQPLERLCVPDGINEAHRVKDLTDAEVKAWCGWYADPTHAARPPVAANDPPGVARFYPSSFSSYGSAVCMLELPSSLCEKNLRVRPDCDATLEEVDDCVETVRAFALGAPGPGWVGHGCSTLLANPKCEGVLVQPYGQNAGEHACDLPLE